MAATSSSRPCRRRSWRRACAPTPWRACCASSAPAPSAPTWWVHASRHRPRRPRRPRDKIHAPSLTLSAMSNPLLEWDALPPFSRILPEQVEPAVDAVLKDNRAAFEALGKLAAPTWTAFIEPQEALGDRLHRVWAPVGHL